jgi:uncharacterized protein (TIGR03435 family)
MQPSGSASKKRFISIAIVAVLSISFIRDAWAQDAASVQPETMMARDANPDWEVATVRPSNPDPAIVVGYHLTGRHYAIVGQTAESLIMVGYGVQKKQILNAPNWIATEKWDVNGVIDTPGQPSEDQGRALVRKLLAERFGLATHTGKRELSVYAITVARGGVKMTPSAGDPNALPDENDSENAGQAAMQMQNAAVAALATVLRFRLDRPVVDKTGLTGRYDFVLKWTVDDTRAPTDGSAAPSLFTAMQDQLGLKLEPVRTMADVVVIDKVGRPSAN